MQTKLAIRSIVALATLGWAGAAWPLSLGPVIGTTVVGRALTLRAPIQFDEGMQVGCVSAELVYGDRSVDSSKVRVDLVHDAARQVSIATISSSAIVDEPVVTVLLQAGCTRPSTRRYVVLAEAPKDEPEAASSSLALAAAEPTRRAPVVALSQPAAAAPRLKVVGARAQGRAPQRHGAAAPSAGTAATRATRVARLEVAVWEPGPEGSPRLRASTELRSTSLADADQRAAATALWRALNAQPQDLLRTDERLRGLEAEVSSLRALAGRLRSDISARDAQQAARNDGYTNLALTMLLALLAVASAAFFWHRSRRAAPVAPVVGWNPVDSRGHAFVDEDSDFAVTPGTVARAQPPAADVSAPAFRARAGRSIVAAPPPTPVVLAPLEFTAQQFTIPHPAALQEGHDSFRLKVDALHDAQQQSEFFASLGQFDEAIAVLTAYLRDCGEKPVLAFLELLRIFHGMNMRVEYEELQTQFRQTFGMDVVSFSGYKEDLRELELFPIAVTRIAASWPAQHALEVINALLFKPPETARDLLSREAYRELIWLYTLGQEIVHSAGAPVGLQLLGNTRLPDGQFVLHWSQGTESGPAELSLDRLNRIDVASELTGFGLDIDLTVASPDARRAAEVASADVTSAPAQAPEPEPRQPEASFDEVMESQGRKPMR